MLQPQPSATIPTQAKFLTLQLGAAMLNPHRHQLRHGLKSGDAKNRLAPCAKKGMQGDVRMGRIPKPASRRKVLNFSECQQHLAENRLLMATQQLQGGPPAQHLLEKGHGRIGMILDHLADDFTGVLAHGLTKLLTTDAAGIKLLEQQARIGGRIGHGRIQGNTASGRKDEVVISPLILPSQAGPAALSRDMVDISIHGLTKRYGAQTVLDQVSLEVAAGEFFFLLGPSGCGKTTLLRHLAGFLQPDAGRVAFGGEDVTRLPPHQRDTGMMFQSYALWPHLSVAENVAFGLEERRLSRAEIRTHVAEALDRVQLGSLGDRRISQLSGGQQQRVALARALVIRPRCLLLDEPLSNLDAKLRHEMRAEIRRIVKAFGLTAIHVTHDRDEALSMADRLAVMDAGRIAQVGTPEEVYRNPGSRMVAEFIGATNLIPATAGAVVGEGRQEVHTAFGQWLGRASGEAPAPCSPVLVSIRPEALVIDPPDPATNTFQARITDLTYLGATAQYEVQVPCGPKLQVCEMNPRVLRHPGETEVRLAVAPEDVLLLPEAG